MGEFLTEIPLNLQIKKPLTQRLVDSLERSEYLGLDYSPTIDGKPVNYILWAREVEPLASELLVPRSFSKFEEMRTHYLEQQMFKYVRGNTDDLSGRRRSGDQFDNLFTEEMLWYWILSTTGVVVERETDAYFKYFEENGYPPTRLKPDEQDPDKALLQVDEEELEKDTRRIINTLSLPTMSPLFPKQKIIDIESAPGKIQEMKKDGFRVGIAFGVWDLCHPGHGTFLQDAKTVMGKFGKLLVAVSSDEETSFLKGEERPIQRFDHRCRTLTRLAIVDGVIPVPFVVETRTPEGVQNFYTGLAEKLSPHYRLIGQREKSYSLFVEQCQKAGIGLLCSDRERITSTTDTINEILAKYPVRG